MAPRILAVAFHFPPAHGSSGVHRVVSFVNHLAAAGWQVSVLTAARRAHPVVTDVTERSVSGDVRVIRAAALDASRHLSIRGYHPDFLSIPDRWQSWIVPAILHAVREHRRSPFDVMYVTYPIPSALVIAGFCARLLGIPWVADLRDPVTQEEYPKDVRLRRRLQSLERRVVDSANHVCVTTSDALEYYATKYCDEPPARWHLIENGFDEERLGPLLRPPGERASADKVTLLHSGLVYRKDRNPGPLFAALRRLEERGRVSQSNFALVFRGSGQDELIVGLAREHGVEHLVSVAPSIPFDEAIGEMCDSDALLVLQGAGVARQIPAKIYEYLYVGRPVIALTNHSGCTGRLLGELGITGVAPLEDATAIETVMERSIAAIRNRSYHVPGRDAIMRFSRAAGAARLEASLESAILQGCRVGARASRSTTAPATSPNAARRPRTGSGAP